MTLNCRYGRADARTIADAVREAGRPRTGTVPAVSEPASGLAPLATLAEANAPRRGHLRILRSDEG